MTAADLSSIFGMALPWIASFVVAFLAVITGVAFLQGRDISFWPPRIGPRVDPIISERAPRSLRAGRDARVDREYGVHKSREFYQEIAAYYDLRSSGNLVSTYLATVGQLQETHKRRGPLRVLDLGGGTGKLIAIHFFNDDDIAWTYVDSCPTMGEKFRHNLAGTPLGANSETIIDTISAAVQDFERESFDIIILSLVLSSMPALPDFHDIARLLVPGGQLIVTDISPGYTRAHPLYRVVVSGRVVALRTQAVDPYEVIRRATAAGLQATRQRTLGEGNTYYSFMTVFASAVVRQPEQLEDDDGLVHNRDDGSRRPPR
jgi:SAM-dependent methyltransferase